MDSWNRSSGKLSANAEARLALDSIAQDLETAFLRNNGQQWLRVEPSTFVNNADAPYDSDQSDSVTLKLFAPALDRESGDGICAIAYKLEYQSSYPNGPLTYALYRMVVDPDQTLENYLSSRFDDPTDDETVQGSLAGDGRDPADWSSATITNVENYLVGNIVAFKILIYDSSQETPKNGTIDYDINGNYIFGGSDSNAGTNAPLYADIILTIVTDQGMTLLNNIAQNLIPDDADDVVTQHGETLIRRVYFKSKPI
jgi:hypothetical protein